MSRGAHRASLIVAGVTMFGGWASARPSEIEVRNVPNDRIMIYWVHTKVTSAGLLVTGSVRRKPLRRGPDWGRIHVTATRQDGTTIDVTTRWKGSLGGRVGRTARFADKVPAANIQSVSVAYDSS